nr:MAG TPA: putative transposase [Caudoviricetes sp.]
MSYKCERFGIKVHTVNEAYTSKCSFIDDEEIGKHDSYLGKRVTTKFFVSKEGRKINADVNAAYNILKLSRGIKFSELDPRQVCGTPKVLKVDYGLNRKKSSHEL